VKTHYINGPTMNPLCNHPQARRIAPDWHKVTCIPCLNHLVNLHLMYVAMGADPPPYEGVEALVTKQKGGSRCATTPP